MTGGLHAVAETDVYIERLDALVADTARRTAQEGCTPGDECRFGDDGDPSSSLSLVVWALTLPSNAVPQKLHNSIVKKALYILDVRFRLLYRGENLATWISPFLNLYMSLDDTSLHLYNASFPSLPHLMTIPDVPLALKALIWRKALLHKQPTAQKQSIVAFLSADWRGGGSGGGNDSADGGATDGGARDVTTSESTVLSYLVEEDGILESVLIPVLASEKTGRGPVGEEIDGLVDGWYQRVGEDAGVDVWSVLGRVVGVMGEHPGRSVGVLVGCARAVCGMLEGAGRRRDIGGLSEPSRSSLEGRIVRAGLGLRKVCFGSNYGAVRCHESLMRAGRAVWGGRGVVEGMLAYLEVVPLGLLVRGGALHEEAKEMIGCVDAEGERGDGRNRLGWWGDGDVGRRHPAAMWLVLYLRGEAVGEADETEVAGVVRDVATRPSPVSSSETLCPIVLLPCLRLLAEDRKRSSTASRLSACLDRLGLVDVFWAAACGYAKSKLPGAGAVRQLMADARARIEGGDRGGFVDNLEPFFEKAWIELRETLAAQWECVALVADLLKERDPEQEEVLRAQLVESRAVLEAAIDEVLREYDDDAVLEGFENADWHALMEVLLFNTRLLSSVAEAMSSLKTSEASEASKVAKTTDFLEAVTSLMDRGPGTLHRSLRGWFEFSIWRAVNESLASGQTDDATISRLAGMAVAGLAQCRDGDRAVVPIIRCVRTIMPRLVGAEDTFTLSSVGAALLGVCQSHQRRRLGVTAAVVTTLVHPCLYSSSTPRIMRDLAHGFVIGLVDAARRYPRLLVTLSSHLAAVLLKAPGDQRLQYIDVLQELLMSGFDVEEQAVELRNEVLDGSLDDVLSSVPREVARAYRLSECAPRIATLCLMHEWATGSEGYDNQDVQDDVRIVDDTGICGKEVCRRLWKRLLDLARTDKALSQGTYMHGGTLHKRKLRLWQAIATLCPAVPDEDVEATLVVMMELLCSHNHASVRYYMELISLSMVLRRPSLLTTRVFPTLADYSSQRRDDLPSLFCVVGVTLDNLQERGEPSYKDFETAAIEHILPWTGAFPHATRTFSQIILADILQRVGRRQSGDYGRDGKVCGDGLDGNLRRLYEFFQSNADLKKMLTAMGMPEGVIPPIRIEKALHPTGIVKSEGYTLISRDYEPRSSKYRNVENTPMSLVERMVEFLQDRRMETRSIRSDILSQAATKEALGCAFDTTKGRGGSETSGSVHCSAEDANWQRKITYDWSGALGLDIVGVGGAGGALDVDVKIDELERALGHAALGHAALEGSASRSASTTPSTSSRSIIVVASFIDKVPNLAGLCRTCEIFQAQALVVGDASVQEHPDFASISVSANTWVRIEEVKRDDVAAWLQGMKRDGGWSLVGLEQTDESVSLPEFRFPDRTILVLGAEKEGVPVDVLRLLDAAVEIPQLGIIRSLNVHVSAALAIYSFRSQEGR